MSSDTLNSPLQVFDEDLLLSDQMLHDTFPGCGSPGMEGFTTLHDFSFFDLPMAAKHDSRLSFSPTAVSTRVGSQTELMNYASCMHHALIIDWVSCLTLNSFQTQSTLPGKPRRPRVLRIQYCLRLLLPSSMCLQQSLRPRPQPIGKISVEHIILDGQGHPSMARKTQPCHITRNLFVNVYKPW